MAGKHIDSHLGFRFGLVRVSSEYQSPPAPCEHDEIEREYRAAVVCGAASLVNSARQSELISNQYAANRHVLSFDLLQLQSL